MTIDLKTCSVTGLTTITLTIARAKEGLANAFGVTTEAVEITIRG